MRGASHSRSAAYARQTPEHGRRCVSASLEEARRMRMRAIFVAALVSLGLGLVGVSSSLAAPAQGAAIVTAAEFGRTVDQAHWRPYRYRHWAWRHHRHHRWWY